VPLLPWAKTPCPDCPAPLSKTEAQKFCDMRGLSITTATEWELAARGADGRLYPWGNKWDSEKGSAGLPVQIGKPMELKPVNAYPKGESPFGLMDMVGNAGDWVDTEGGFLNAHMGGIYSYNEEEAYTFKLMPDRGEIQPMKQITARCVSKDFS
jgi:formylglycine-generating enzyme required for sulfatase activity